MLSTVKQTSDGAPVVRLGYLVSHPIQYQAPLLRRIAQEPDVDLTVLFASNFSVRGYKDKGFGVDVTWDVPLLEGYKHQFLPSLLDRNDHSTFTRPLNHSIHRYLLGPDGRPRFDALWVHGYATLNALYGIVTANALGIPVLLRAESWLRDRERSGAKLFAKRMFFDTLKRLITAALPIGTVNSDYWTHYFGEDVPQYLMPYAVDNSFFERRSLEAASSRPALQAELQLDPARPVILFASKLQKRKHCDDLLEAYIRMAPPGGEPLPYLVIVGDGEMRSALETRAAATSFSSIRFCGFRNQSELPRFFDLCSVFVLPSRHEPWGLIVNEVMNAGRAVIVSDDVGSHHDLITNGVEGIVYPVRDVAALTAALERVLASPETAAAMGAKAKERIQSWSFEQDVQSLRAALSHVTGKL